MGAAFAGHDGHPLLVLCVLCGDVESFGGVRNYTLIFIVVMQEIMQTFLFSLETAY